MHLCISGDSERSSCIKSDIREMITCRLNDPQTQWSDETLMVILNLISADLWMCDEAVLGMHQKIVAEFVERRGGLRSSHNTTMAEVSAA